MLLTCFREYISICANIAIFRNKDPGAKKVLCSIYFTFNYYVTCQRSNFSFHRKVTFSFILTWFVVDFCLIFNNRKIILSFSVQTYYFHKNDSELIQDHFQTEFSVLPVQKWFRSCFWIHFLKSHLNQLNLYFESLLNKLWITYCVIQYESVQSRLNHYFWIRFAIVLIILWNRFKVCHSECWNILQ